MTRTMLISGSLALGSAACTALSSVLTAELRHYPTDLVGFCLSRMLTGTLLTALLATAVGGWSTLGWAPVAYLALSGVVGLFLGELAFNASILQIGAQSAMLVFSVNAPM